MKTTHLRLLMAMFVLLSSLLVVACEEDSDDEGTTDGDEDGGESDDDDDDDDDTDGDEPLEDGDEPQEDGDEDGDTDGDSSQEDGDEDGDTDGDEDGDAETVDCFSLTQEQCGNYDHCKPFMAQRKTQQSSSISCVLPDLEYAACTTAYDCGGDSNEGGVAPDGTCYFFHEQCPPSDWILVNHTGELRESYEWCFNGEALCPETDGDAEEEATE